MNNLLAERLRKIRIEKGISQQKLGALFSVSQQAVGKWEKGIAEPDSLTLNKLADYFDVTVDYLLGRTDSPDLAIPKEIENMQFAFHGGINTDGLSKEDIDTLKKMADFMRSNKN